MVRDSSADYYALDFSALRRLFVTPSLWFVVPLIIVWAYAAYQIFSDSYIQYSPDTFLYKALSQEPVTLQFLVRGIRSPTLPLLLKLFRTETAFVYFQLGLFYLSWLTLFVVMRQLFASYIVYVAMLCVIAPLSLSPIYFSWHKLILTESISLSGSVLLLALMCRFVALEKVSHATVNCLLVPWVLWQFTRDANAFFSLALAAGFWVICMCASLSDRENEKWRKGKLVAIIMCVVAAFQMYTINQSDRWKFPLVDVIALRILPDPALTQEFVDMGMPLNERVTCFTGQTAVDCGKDWSGFGQWLEGGEARDDYQHWLLANFPRSLKEIFTSWEKIWTTETILYGRALQSGTLKKLSEFALPKGQEFLLFILASGLAAWLALSVAVYRGLASWLSILLMFFVANLPLAFVAYHGDALDVDRHTLNVQLNTYLTGWILIFWSFSFVLNGFYRLLLWLVKKARGAAAK